MKNSVPEMHIWSTLLIQSDLKLCVQLSTGLFLYITTVRPIADKNSGIQETLDLMLTAIYAILAEQQIFHAYIWIEITWTDCSVMCNSSKYEGTDSVLLSLKNL